MAKLPDSLIRTKVSDPNNGRGATAEDFGAGKDTLIGAGRSASNASRGAADSARARGGAIRSAADAQLRADLSLAGGVNQIGQAAIDFDKVLYDRKEQRERSLLNAKLSDAQARWAVGLDEAIRKADPNDDGVVDRFLKGFDEEAKGLADGLETRGAKELARDGVGRLRGHFFETAMKGAAHLAGVASKQDIVKAQSASSNALLADPSGLGVAVERFDSHLDYLVEKGKLSRADALEIGTGGRADLARSAVEGEINLNWKSARERLKAGEWKDYLDARATTVLINKTEEKEREIRIEQERQRAEARRQHEESQRSTGGQFVGLLAAGKLDPATVTKSNLDWREKEHFLEAIERKSKEGTKEPATDFATAHRFAERIESGNPPTRAELIGALWKPDGKGINDTVYNQLTRMMDVGEKQEERAVRDEAKTLKQTARRAILGSNFLDPKDPESEAAYYKYQAELDETVQKYRDEGKDWRPLFDPNSNEFLGKRIPAFIATRDQMRKDLRNKLRGEATMFGGAAGAQKKSAADRVKELMGGGK